MCFIVPFRNQSKGGNFFVPNNGSKNKTIEMPNEIDLFWIYSFKVNIEGLFPTGLYKVNIL
ncbi:hypothetical protein D3C80_1634840 [compost metagenome]